jgi:hypothetical protein
MATRNISMSFINQGHNDIIPFSWIAESGNSASTDESSVLGFTIEASNSSYLNYSAVINRDNSGINAVPYSNTPTVYVPQDEGAKYQHEKSFYVDIIAKDASGIKEVRAHVEPNKYGFKEVKDIEKVFMIPKFSWTN